MKYFLKNIEVWQYNGKTYPLLTYDKKLNSLYAKKNIALRNSKK